MNKYIAIIFLAITITFIAITTNYAHEHDNISTKDMERLTGKSESQMKEIDKKIIKYIDTIESNPDDADAHFNLGILYEKKIKYNDAIAEYQKTINLFLV